MNPKGRAPGKERPGLRGLVGQLLHERLDPGRGAAAVFLGVTLGIVPIYGLQSLVALALASLFRLNRPLTFAATFINNPLLQPFLVIGSLQLGHLATGGSLVSVSPAALAESGLGVHLLPLLVGSVLLSAAVGGTAAAVTFVWLVHRNRTDTAERAWRAEIDRLFQAAPRRGRRFVYWKVRLDRIFWELAREDLGTGPAVDLGCGYGTALAVLALKDPTRELHGCDLDAARVRTASLALASPNVRLSVGDVRTFPLPSAGLILILDVLQYLDADEQASLLKRCTAALEPGGHLIFRLPDTTRGFHGWMTRSLDRIIFWVGRVSDRPAYQTVESYERLLAKAGMTVAVWRSRNRLPLAHVVIAAARPR
jgi:uncharacterized protein (DUF2062 family)/SAM-dependent methyltransferase